MGGQAERRRRPGKFGDRYVCSGSRHPKVVCLANQKLCVSGVELSINEQNLRQFS